ncbi:MAG: hypothetical protein QOG21_2329 [Actinomycetota bacterium]|nr:hypothetical protein [Actinomycetota bacterium]
MTSMVIAAVWLPACAPRSVRTGPPPALGPPRVQLAVVQQRARWFDTDDPIRVAGSQQELVAGSYLLARLEEAGYLVNLDPVPVGNLLHSTNVIALPPSGHATIVVVADYDTSSSAPSDGAGLGTFLEVARALRVVDPNHSVEFVALGAEHIAINGGQVGGRSLIELLKGQSPLPRLVRIGDVSGGSAQPSVAGPAAPSIRSVAARAHIPVRGAGSPPSDVFTRAGFAETVIGGGLSAGPVLLTFLTAASKQ